MSEINNNFQEEKFKCFVRFMINIAKEKRCVTYKSIENIFGLNHKQAGYYAGMIGNYCIDRNLPLLNSLIINSTDCIPSYGFDWYQNEAGESWGEVISRCWREFHVTQDLTKQSQDFSGRDDDVADFLNNQ